MITPLSRSIHQSRAVMVLNPNRSSSRNCSNQFSGIEATESSTLTRKRMPAWAAAEWPKAAVK